MQRSGFLGTFLLEPLIKKGINFLRISGFILILLLLIAFIKADFLTSLAEDSMFVDECYLRRKFAVSAHRRDKGGKPATHFF